MSTLVVHRRKKKMRMDGPTERTDGSTRALHRATDGRTVSFVVDRNSTLDRSLDRSTRSFSRALISINHPFVRPSVGRLNGW